MSLLKSIAKLESELGSDITITSMAASKKFKSNESVSLKVYLPGKSIGLSGEYGLEFRIHIQNLEQFLVEKYEKTHIDRKLGDTLSEIVFSTARGIIFERTSSTFFNGVLLPVIDPNLIWEYY